METTQSESKICTQCNNLLPLSDFYRNNAGFTGKRNKCKKCSLAARTYTKEKEKKEAGIIDYNKIDAFNKMAREFLTKPKPKQPN